MKKIWLVLALALAVATGSYGAAVASANHGHAGKGHGTAHGTVTGTDTTANTITLTTFHKCDSMTINLTDNTRIRVNHHSGTLLDIQPGMGAVVKLAKDGTAKRIHAWTTHKHNLLHGTVTGTDTVNNTITLSLKKTCATTEPLQLTSDTKVKVNHSKGTLADIQNGYRALVKLNKDDTVRWIKARAPKS
jgi:hypothetical protein